MRIDDALVNLGSDSDFGTIYQKSLGLVQIAI